MKPSLSFVVFLSIALLGTNSAYSSLVHIETFEGETGGGYSVARDSECYVITPLHVVQFASEITIHDERGNRASANVSKFFKDVDLALLQVDKPEGFLCLDDWQSGAGGAEFADKVDFLMYKRIRSDQSSERHRLFFAGRKGTTHYKLKPYSNDDPVVEGDSGAALYAGEHLIGLIQSVNSKSKEIIALRQDVIHSLVKEIVLKKQKKTIFIDPVRRGYKEIRVGTITAISVLEETNDYFVKESPPVERYNRRKQPPVPPGADYVLRCEILNMSQKRRSNPTYLGDTVKKTKREIGGLIGSALESLASNSGISGSRYLYEYKIEMELQLLDILNGRKVSYLARNTFRSKDDERVNSQNSAIENTIIKAIPELLKKSDL